MKKRRLTCARRPLSSPCHGRVASRRMHMSSVLRREVEVAAPLASELSGAGQSSAESSPGVLLGFSFLILVLMVNITIQVPRFRLEKMCSHRRRVVVKVVVVVIRGDGTSAARPLLGKKENLTLSRFAISSAPPPKRLIRST
jgi:hypothetical protein